MGLGAAGPQGLVRVLELLEDEVRICLGLLGVTSFAELTPAHITTALPANQPGIFSAFPHLHSD
jgi:glycolate oxidase